MKTNTFLQEYWYEKIFTKKDLDNYMWYNSSLILKWLIKKWIISNIKKGYYYINSYWETDILSHPFFFIKLIWDWKWIISHWTALTYYWLLEQFFNSTVITLTNHLTYNNYTIAWYDYIITKNKFNNNFWIKKIFVENNRYIITDIERTILDSFSRPDLARWYKEVAKAMYEAIDEWRIDFTKLLDYLKHYSNKIKLAKTIWFFIDVFNLDIKEDIYNYLYSISNNSNYVYLDSKTKDLWKWIYNSKWKLILNEFENFNSITKY